MIFDGLGREAAAESFEARAPRGHWVVYGQATGPVNISEFELNKKSGTVSNPVLFHYTQDHLQEMAGNVFAALRNRTIWVEVRHRYPLAAAAAAHRDLEARRTTGSIVLQP